jgi:hypothetical protein
MKIAIGIAIGCAALIVLAIVAVASLIGFISLKKTKYDKVAIPFIESYIVELSSWEPDRVRQYWAPEVLAQLDPEETERLFLAYRQLGALQSHDPPLFLQVGAHTKIPYSALVTYQVPARFDGGEALLTIQLVPTESEGLKVWHIHIESDAFLPQLESPADTPEVEQAPAG